MKNHSMTIRKSKTNTNILSFKPHGISCVYYIIQIKVYTHMCANSGSIIIIYRRLSAAQ